MNESLESERKWHLEKRVSVGHLVTTAAVIFSVIAWSVQIQGKIDRNDLRISKMEEAVRDLRTSGGAQYTEIIRRLERIDGKMDAHLQDHAKAHRSAGG